MTLFRRRSSRGGADAGAEDGPTERAEADLIRRAQASSEEAWTEIFDAHYVKVYRYCYARCGDDATAAELASSVFLAAYEGIGRFVYRGRPLLAWLYRIAHNMVSDYLEARRRESDATAEATALAERHGADPASEVVNRAEVESALAELTEDQRQIVALRFFADLRTSEIADCMERTEAAVYSLEVRALAALRRVLEPSTDVGSGESPGAARQDPAGNRDMPQGRYRT